MVAFAFNSASLKAAVDDCRDMAIFYSLCKN